MLSLFLHFIDMTNFLQSQLWSRWEGVVNQAQFWNCNLNLKQFKDDAENH